MLKSAFIKRFMALYALKWRHHFRFCVKKVNFSYSRDYYEDFHEKIKSKSALLKIFTAIETVFFRLITGRLDSDANKRFVQIFNKADSDLIFPCISSFKSLVYETFSFLHKTGSNDVISMHIAP